MQDYGIKSGRKRTIWLVNLSKLWMAHLNTSGRSNACRLVALLEVEVHYFYSLPPPSYEWLIEL